MQEWEYKVIPLRFSDYLEQQLTIEGRDGWELVSVDNGTAYFKRSIFGFSKIPNQYDTWEKIMVLPISADNWAETLCPVLLEVNGLGKRVDEFEEKLEHILRDLDRLHAWRR